MSNIKQIITQILENPNTDTLLFKQAIQNLSSSLKPFSAGKDPIFAECRILINKLTSFLPSSAELRTRIWHLTTNTQYIPKCKVCDNSVNWDRAAQAYRPYCSSRCKGNDLEIKSKTAATNLQRYGAISPTQNKEVLEKVQQTNLKRYGCHPRQIEEIKNKQKQTCLDRYGVDNPTKSPQIREKVRQTNLKRYGCHPKQTKEAQDLYKKTCNERFGGHPKQTKEVQDKFKQTCLDKYRVDNPTKSFEIRKKVKQTNLVTHGVVNPNYIKNSHVLDILPLIHDYNWLFNEYIILNKTSAQIADDLGVGGTTILRALHKHGIGITPQSNISNISTQWLNQIREEQNITIIPEFTFNPNNKRHKADGYCAETNTIYEFHGDYWHGNPKIYEPDYINEVNDKTMGELYQRTTERENEIISLGYSLIVMWESDFNV